MSEDENIKENDESSDQNRVLTSARAYVRRRFNEELAPIYLFHNLTYSVEIADKVVEIGKGEGLSPEEVERLEIAGLFYPLGFIGGDEEVWLRSATEMR